MKSRSNCREVVVQVAVSGITATRSQEDDSISSPVIFQENGYSNTNTNQGHHHYPRRSDSTDNSFPGLRLHRIKIGLVVQEGIRTRALKMRREACLASWFATRMHHLHHAKRGEGDPLAVVPQLQHARKVEESPLPEVEAAATATS